MQEKVNRLKDSLVHLWQNVIPYKFKAGELIYERQFQAEIYHQLVTMHYPEYKFWIEPPLAADDKRKIVPDMLVTTDKSIICAIEIKWKIWEEVHYKDDLSKLKELEKFGNKGKEQRLSVIPATPIWKDQNVVSKPDFTFSDSLLSVFIVFARPDSWALKPEKIKEIGLKNLLYLYGHLDRDKNGKAYFEKKIFPNDS